VANVPSQSRKHRGYKSQKIVANYLAANGWPYAESTGAGRSGTDITGTIGIDWEVKARKDFNPSAAIKQLKERHNGKDLPVAVLRLNGQGEVSITEWVTILRLEDFVTLLKEAGYADGTS
jgi:hypothetical protein